VAVPTLLRWAIDSGSSASPFVTYYPAVSLAALFLGWRWGAVVAVVSTLVADRMFSADPFWELLMGPHGVVVGLFALSCSVLILTGEMVRRLVRELESTHAREELLNQELMHRVKNMLATVNAMALLTARHSKPGQFTKAFTGRMKALDRATDLLGTGRAPDCEVQDLVSRALEPFRTDHNFEVQGPACQVPRDACVPLSLALHELCTNAAKHGALAVPQGKVMLTWAHTANGRLQFQWREQGGPPIAEQRPVGMGTQLLRSQRGLSAVDLRFPREGAECDIEIEDAELGQ
jgi:two-component sensor histidine kinase